MPWLLSWGVKPLRASKVCSAVAAISLSPTFTRAFHSPRLCCRLSIQLSSAYRSFLDGRGTMIRGSASAHTHSIPAEMAGDSG